MDGQLHVLLHFYMQTSSPLYLKRHKFECQKELGSQVGSSRIITGLLMTDRSCALAGYDWQEEVL